MAGQKHGVFRELISSFIKNKLAELEYTFGCDSKEYQAIARQYVKSEREEDVHLSRERSFSGIWNWISVRPSNAVGRFPAV